MAVGEIGLDFHTEGFNQQLQEEIFAKQIKLAHKFILFPRSRAASEESQPDSPSDYIHLVLALEKHIT